MTFKSLWESIPHKTRPDGGSHGFTGPIYFENCNAALDALYVKRQEPAPTLRAISNAASSVVADPSRMEL